MATLEVVNPQATTVIEAVAPAPRLDTMRGKTIGLYWNMKSGGDTALERTAKLLEERYPDTEFKQYIGSVGAVIRHATDEDIEQVVDECDAVVGTTSD
ncbi:MAG: hypothetical protein FI707_10660 [SAR202 cluster bacterium]|jgi:hypothetical protein|nr:hypothetical protein [Chloroflexota bacterium]MDP6419840.1 hypothetical protein [SAR202 cluster bacterium]HAL48555.1 hypothetical protein [Dehalococcoidia bacterium]MDP6665193.1 hypothetical protein [SAR202 cluster bacterium]MQG58090.1 hypothetical protein [SAR202 cluster bacterium]|tara:strand:- start:4085 stop:4378 length:294 start_codon:yes stop_codon:yes gene_type:complete